LDAIFAEPVPIDPLLPVHAGDAEIRSHRVLPLVVKVFVPTRASLPTEVGAQGDVRHFWLFSVQAARPQGACQGAWAGTRAARHRPAGFVCNPKIAVHGVVAVTIFSIQVLSIQVLRSEMPR